jgi:hypothetical protein
MADTAEKVRQRLSTAQKMEDQLNSEKGTIDTLLLNGATLYSIVESGNNPTTGQGKYKRYLEDKVSQSKKHIKDLKDDDKFYRRDFLEGKPQIVQPSAFWKNSDNIILTFLWSAVFLILIPLSFGTYALPFDSESPTVSSNKAMALIIIMWIIVIGLVLYILQHFA